jgi:hypothetical protein
MKTTVKAILILAGVLLTAGCIVVSLNPLYDSEKDLVFDPALVGTWGENNGKDSMTFIAHGDKRYECTYTVDSIPNNFEVNLVQLGKYRFLDFYPTPLEKEPAEMNGVYLFHLVPTHSISKLWIENDQLYISTLNLDWLKNQIAQKKIKIGHKQLDDRMVLTASTKELQKFILKYANDTAAFEKPDKGLNRIK